MMKVLLWLYAVVGSSYAAMYFGGVEDIARYAVGPMWVLMTAAPITLVLLIVFTFTPRVS